MNHEDGDGPMRSKILWLLAAGLLAGSPASRAAFVFSDVLLTPNSVTFSIDGKMSGYATSPLLDNFAIVYFGDLWAGTPNNYAPNVWSTSVFDNETRTESGNTGGFDVNDYNYSWSNYQNSLADAVATNRRVTLLMGKDFLNPNASGEIRFVWGNGYADSGHTVLQTIRFPGTVPEPGTFALLGLGLGGIGLMRRRFRNASA